jgi:WD40 repeat protein
VTTGKVLRTCKAHKTDVCCLALSKDGKRALSGSADGLLVLWDLGAGAEVGRSQGAVGSVRSLAFSPDGRQALVGGPDGTVRLLKVPAAAAR